MFNGWHNKPYNQSRQKAATKANTEIEPISATLINGVHFDPYRVIERATEIARTAAQHRDKGELHSCANCPRQFNKGT